MKIKALVTTLILGSSSLALAAPTYGPIARDHREPVAQSHASAGFARWKRPQLAPVLLADNARVSGRSSIDVSAQTRAFTKLEVKANRGRTDLDRVLIVFGNGQRQVVSLRGKLATSRAITANKSLTIDLDGGARNIKSVMLIGTSGRRASVDLIAS